MRKYGTECPEIIGITSSLYFHLCIVVSRERGTLDLFSVAERIGASGGGGLREMERLYMSR
jgi:hypothetical protein